MPRVADTSPRHLPRTFDALVALYPPRPIRDEVDHANAQSFIDALTSLPDPTPDQRDYLETLTVLFEAYENAHHGIDVDGIGPADVLRHLLDEHGMSASDLGRLLGERSLGPKVLNGDRALSKTHIRALAAHFKVSPALFL